MSVFPDAGVLFSQALSVAVATALVLFGAASLYAHKRWQENGFRTQGEIIGMREKRERGEQTFFYPVYRYKDASGATREKVSAVGWSATQPEKIGQIVSLIVHPDDPADVREADSTVGKIAGLVLIGCAAVPVANMLMSGNLNFLTLVMILMAAVYARARIHAYAAGERHVMQKIMKPLKNLDPDFYDTDAQQKNVRAQILDKQALEEIDARKQPVIILVCFALSAALFAGGYYFGEKTQKLVEQGIRTEATVVAFETSSKGTGSDKTTSKHPVLSFTDDRGREIVFRSNYGGNVLNYTIGEKAKIFYLPENPDETAELDLGIYNWALPGGLWLFAAFCLMGGISNLRRYMKPKVL